MIFSIRRLPLILSLALVVVLICNSCIEAPRPALESTNSTGELPHNAEYQSFIQSIDAFFKLRARRVDLSASSTVNGIGVSVTFTVVSGTNNKDVLINGILLDAQNGIVATSKGDFSEISKISVRILGTNQELGGKIVAHDERTQLTLIKLDTQALPLNDALSLYTAYSPQMH